MKLIGPFSEIRLLDNKKVSNSYINSNDFPIRDGGVLLIDSKIADIGDFALLYSKYKEEKEIEIEEIEEQQVLMLFDSSI